MHRSSARTDHVCCSQKPGYVHTHECLCLALDSNQGSGKLWPDGEGCSLLGLQALQQLLQPEQHHLKARHAVGNDRMPSFQLTASVSGTFSWLSDGWAMSARAEVCAWRIMLCSTQAAKASAIAHLLSVLCSSICLTFIAS